MAVSEEAEPVPVGRSLLSGGEKGESRYGFVRTSKRMSGNAAGRERLFTALAESARPSRRGMERTVYVSRHVRSVCR